jgi:hypothetical protein
MAVVLTVEHVRKALRDHRAGKSRYDLLDAAVRGLALRVGKSGCRWSLRLRWGDQQRRWDLGAVAERDHEGIVLQTARNWALEAKEQARRGIFPGPFLDRITGRTAPSASAARPRRPEMRWEAAVESFLDGLYNPKKPEAATHRPATRKDYASKLQTLELNRFRGRPVGAISREEIAEAVNTTCKRAYDMGCGSLRSLKSFYGWLRDPARARETGVTVSIADLRPPPRPRSEVGAPGLIFDPEIELRGKAPPEIEIGRLLAISRSGVLPEPVGLGFQLLLASVQRRRQTIGADSRRIFTFDEVPDERVWFVPPFFRKTRKKGSRSHLVPLVGFGVTAHDRLAELSAADGRPWLLPHRDRSIDAPAGVNLLNRWIERLPGISCSTHGGRYAFATYGPRDLSFARSEARLILDHSEGLESDDVTGQFYCNDPAIARKREMMSRWTAWLEHWCSEAIRKDGLLSDAAALRAALRAPNALDV